MDRKAGVSLLAAVGVSLVLIVARAGEALAQTASATAELRISGAVTTPLVLTIADLKNMPRKKLSVLDSGILDSDVIVADTMDGAPLGANQGPFRLVAPHERRPARWVRMLKSITVARAANP
jgi:DMSO/TMAO reductase YedYZ molybdopterin-dependent catalytic subunit